MKFPHMTENTEKKKKNKSKKQMPIKSAVQDLAQFMWNKLWILFPDAVKGFLTEKKKKSLSIFNLHCTKK